MRQNRDTTVETADSAASGLLARDACSEGLAWTIALAGLAAMLALGAASMASDGHPGSSGAGSETSATVRYPCPSIERLCDDPDPPDGDGETDQCDCGTGLWERVNEDSRFNPPTPHRESLTTSVGSCRFYTTASAQAARHLAWAQVSLLGKSSFWDAGSHSLDIEASYASIERDLWRGDGPACPREVNLAAMGGAMLHISASAAPRAGCTAAASGSVGGFCSSRGNANASIGPTALNGIVGYNSASESWEVEGNFGSVVSIDTPSIQGSLNSEGAWEVDGTGSHSGSATFIVKPDRTYCAWTNKSITLRAVGITVAGAAGSVDDNGSCAAIATASIALWAQ